MARRRKAGLCLRAVAGAASVLTAAGDNYDAKIYLAYTRRIVELMGGEGPGLDDVAQEIFDDWNQHHHFTLYEDVPLAVAWLQERGIKTGLISNTARCLRTFQDHFELAGVFTVAVSSSAHGFMKPHPSIFKAALAQMGVGPTEAVMVGDSLLHDVIGARRAGMRGVLLARGARARPSEPDFDVISSLAELPALLSF